MSKIYINEIPFDIEDVKNMIYIMDQYPSDGDRFYMPEIDIQTLERVRNYSILFRDPFDIVLIPVPLYIDPRDIIGDNIFMWLSLLSSEDIYKLYNASISLKYNYLYDAISIYLGSQNF